MTPASAKDTSDLLTGELSARELRVAEEFLRKLAASEARLAGRAQELLATSGDDAHAALARETRERARVLQRLHRPLDTQGPTSSSDAPRTRFIMNARRRVRASA